MNQSLTIPRCCTSLTPLHQTAFWIIGFTDDSLDYSAACIYLISASKVNTDCKAQLITTTSKIATHNIATEVSVPHNETQEFQMGAELLLNITTIMTELAIPISKCILFCDAISTIISYNNHPANYTHPASKWLATTNIQLYKVAEMASCVKEDIVLYINQKKS